MHWDREPWRQASLPAVEGGIFAARNRRDLVRAASNQFGPLKGCHAAPPGWAAVAPKRRYGAPRRRKARLYGRQDACRYGTVQGEW